MPVTLDKPLRNYLAIVAPSDTSTVIRLAQRPAHWRDASDLITQLNNTAKANGHVLTGAAAVDRYSATIAVTTRMNKAYTTLNHPARPTLAKTPMGAP